MTASKGAGTFKAVICVGIKKLVLELKEWNLHFSPYEIIGCTFLGTVNTKLLIVELTLCTYHASKESLNNIGEVFGKEFIFFRTLTSQLPRVFVAVI